MARSCRSLRSRGARRRPHLRPVHPALGSRRQPGRGGGQHEAYADDEEAYVQQLDVETGGNAGRATINVSGKNGPVEGTFAIYVEGCVSDGILGGSDCDEGAPPAVRSHDGRIVKLLVDGALAEFPAASATLACAVRTPSETAHDAVRLRAGLYVGEITEEGDVVGDAVNLPPGCSRRHRKAACSSPVPLPIWREVSLASL